MLHLTAFYTNYNKLNKDVFEKKEQSLRRPLIEYVDEVAG